MHLKLDSSGSIDDGDVARDLGQEAADIVVLSAADSDLAAFGAAYATLAGDFPSVRLTNLLALGHPASVDLYVERTLSQARIVVLRMLGGESYWPHGSKACVLTRCVAERCSRAYPARWTGTPHWRRAARSEATNPHAAAGAIAAKAVSRMQNSRYVLPRI